MSLLPLTFIFPLIGFLILAFMRDKLSEMVAAIVGVGSMLLSALLVKGARVNGAQAGRSKSPAEENQESWS